MDGPVVIVGGGVAGLVSAHLLQEAGCETVVLEKFHTVGGLARSYQYDDFVFDIGPHRFHTENPVVKAYLDRVIQGDGTWFPRVSEVYFKGAYYSWPIKPRNLLQLPKPLAARAAVDLAINSFREYEVSSFEDYVLRQYGPTLYREFFAGYSHKFLGIHPRDTHPDWAKTGINRAIIDENAQMQNLSQLLRATLAQSAAKDVHYLYPTRGMHQAWAKLSAQLIAAGGQIHTGSPAALEGAGGRVRRVRAGDRVFEPSVVIWTGPITQAMEQLGHEPAELPYLGLLIYNVCLEGEVPRGYQWCYYGARDLLINRISIPRNFSRETAPSGGTGLCVEVTCMVGDERWRHAERLTDWVVDDLVKVGLIGSRLAVHDVYVERIPESYPIYHRRYPGELERARRTLGGYDNLYLAGRTGMFWYNNMDHSIENAIQLSRRLLRDAGRAQISEARLAAGLSEDRGDADGVPEAGGAQVVL